jgi:CPA1 family monovalent cation:H+ antiporter
MENVEIILLVILLVASLVAIISRRIRLPYTIGLVLAGLLLSLVGSHITLHLSKELIFTALLPPLIFEAAFHLRWKDLKPELPAAITLATLGVVFAAATSCLVLVFFGGQSWQTALIIGVILAATDPVSVLALLKESKLPPRIHRLIESESIFNDGTAAVLFSLVPLMLIGSATVGQFSIAFVIAVALGIFTGGCVGYLALMILGKTEDHLVEITVTTVAAFASFILAEELHASGVLSTLTAGMILGNLGHLGSISTKGHEAAASFWEFAGFISNSVIFLLIGIDLAMWQRSGVANLMIWTIIASFAGRAVAVYLGCLPLHFTKKSVPLPVQHLLFFGGLRGALGLALVLGLPAETPLREQIVYAVFVAVAFSIVVQGLTAGWVIKRSESALSALSRTSME